MTSAKRELLRFGAVGLVGFAIDAAVLTWLVTVQDWGLVEARVLSFALAVTATWYLNRRLTFRHRASARRGREYGRYFAVQTVGAAINLGVYVLVVAVLPALAEAPALPLAVGSGTAMVFNFLASRHFAFAGASGREARALDAPAAPCVKSQQPCRSTIPSSP